MMELTVKSWGDAHMATDSVFKWGYARQWMMANNWDKSATEHLLPAKNVLTEVDDKSIIFNTYSRIGIANLVTSQYL